MKHNSRKQNIKTIKPTKPTMIIIIKPQSNLAEKYDMFLSERIERVITVIHNSTNKNALNYNESEKFKSILKDPFK